MVTKKPKDKQDAASAEPDKPAPQNCPVVGFGASAGGLQAMSEVLSELPDDAGMAIVFVQHLDPSHASMLSELLARVTEMPVLPAEDKQRVEPNHVYVLPPNAALEIRDGVLRVTTRVTEAPHMPIDFFFRSLAEDQGSKAIGVVLSGTASDGTLGLKAIKAAGGITIAQEPQTANYDGMPRSAIAAGCVDTTLSPAGIAAELVRLCRHPYLAPPPAQGEFPEHEKAFDEILAILRTAKGVDFTQYKPGTVRRRTLRRMAIHRLESPEKYVMYLKNNRDEVDLLFNDVLIHVTSFFREPATFEAIAQHVLPALFKARAPDDPFRVWVPGCATGEEAYSTAICILEYVKKMEIEQPIQLFGTDLSEAALEQARAGEYPQSIEADVSPERLRRFFVQANGMYQIARSVRDICVFARQNVTKDPPFSRIDLITCRNLLIYLGSALQAKTMRFFHYALKPSGFLVLGASETVGGSTDLFAPLDRHHKIYTRKPSQAPVVNDFASYEEPHRREPANHPPSTPTVAAHEHAVDQVLLACYAPPSVVIDADMRVLQFRGDTSAYLRHSPGVASLSLMKMARGSLGAEIRKLVQTPGQPGLRKSKTVSVNGEGSQKSVQLTVIPLDGGPDHQYLVAFEEAKVPEARPAPARASSRDESPAEERAHVLELELNSTKNYLNSVIEEQEAAAEELKSAHEEVQSSNEELQSTNEELLTAKEELQSTNEELTTLNDEMQSRNAELQQTNNDLTNLLASVNIPTVMLGQDLRIRRFTPQAEKLLNLLPSDLGRPIRDFHIKINVPDLVPVCQEVIDSLVPREREVVDAEGRLYSMWVRPYRTADNRIDGLVLTLLDVTDRRNASDARFRRMFEAAKDGIVMADLATGQILECNPAVSTLSGVPRGSLIGTRFWETELFRGTEIDEGTCADLRAQGAVHKTLTLTTRGRTPIPVEVVASRYQDGDKEFCQFNLRDIRPRKRLEEQQQRLQENLRDTHTLEAVGALAGGVAHDFNNIVTALAGYAGLLRERVAADQTAVDMVEQIRLGTERAATLTRQLLAFGHRQIIKPSLLDVNALIEELRQVIGVTLAKDVDLELRLSPDTARVRADPGQLEQVIVNLAINARNAMPDGGTLTIRTENVETDPAFSEKHPTVPPGRYVAITIQDTGSGMDEQTQRHMYEPFSANKPAGSGIGLGLPTVYNILKDAGGYIWALSELGVGTTFTVYLPRVERGAAQEEQPPPPGLGTETVLLVDSDHAVRALSRRFLEKRGYRVLEAGSGPEALRLVREYTGPLHLLITEVVMPRMSGRELALQLAGERPDMRVLFLSGHTEDAIVHHGVLGDSMEFLRKPFSHNEFVDRVHRILNGNSGGRSKSE